LHDSLQDVLYDSYAAELVMYSITDVEIRGSHGGECIGYGFLM